MQPELEQRLAMYRNMVTSRYYEERITEIYMEGKTPRFDMANGPIPGEMHLSNGQEPVAVGVCAHLEDGDVVTATHRPHHIAIAKGVDLNAMTAEIFGKRTGLSGGRGGHMHLFDTRVNFACSGIIAQGMGPARGSRAGAAVARRAGRGGGLHRRRGRQSGRFSRGDEPGGTVVPAVRLRDRRQRLGGFGLQGRLHLGAPQRSAGSGIRNSRLQRGQRSPTPSTASPAMPLPEHARAMAPASSKYKRYAWPATSSAMRRDTAARRRKPHWPGTIRFRGTAPPCSRRATAAKRN